MDAKSPRWHRVTASTFPWEVEAIELLRARSADADCPFARGEARRLPSGKRRCPPGHRGRRGEDRGPGDRQIRFRQRNTPTIAAGEKALGAIGIKASDRSRRAGSWLLLPDPVAERPCVQTRGLVVFGSTIGTHAWLTIRHRPHARTGTHSTS